MILQNILGAFMKIYSSLLLLLFVLFFLTLEKGKKSESSLCNAKKLKFVVKSQCEGKYRFRVSKLESEQFCIYLWFLWADNSIFNLKWQNALTWISLPILTMLLIIHFKIKIQYNIPFLLVFFFHVSNTTADWHSFFWYHTLYVDTL